MKRLLFFCFLCVTTGCFAAETQRQPQKPANNPQPPKVNLKTLAVYQHDPGAYTQGLVYRDGYLYESTGQYGLSTLRQVEVQTGKVLQKIPLKSEFFAEGIEIIDDKIYILTWEEQRCFVFEKDSFKFVKTFKYSGQGWGLAYDGTHLILSDGTSILRFYDPETFTLQKQLTVFDGETEKNGKKVQLLNELEMVNGELWANVWKSPYIARIDPKTGRVIGWINFTDFIPKELQEEHKNPRTSERVLNGIAYDHKRKILYITGKNWPVMYEIECVWDAQ